MRATLESFTRILIFFVYFTYLIIEHINWFYMKGEKNMFRYKRTVRREKNERENFWFSTELITTEDSLELEDLNEILLKTNENMLKYLEEIQKNM